MINKFGNSIVSNYNKLMSFDSVDALKGEVLSLLRATNENNVYSRKIVINISSIRDLVSLQKYVTNCMLKHMGYGLSNHRSVTTNTH